MPPSLEPQQVCKDVWYYEHPRTIEMHIDVRDESGDFLKHVSFLVPFRKLVRSMKRCYKPGKRAALKEAADE